jgi:hypothetical protein
MFKSYRIQKEFRKDILTQPLYKPLKITNESLDVDFSQSLIDACHLIHKSMIGVLQLNYKGMENKKEIDHLANKNSDYLGAVYLHLYFTQWLTDVRKMSELAEGGE